MRGYRAKKIKSLIKSLNLIFLVTYFMHLLSKSFLAMVYGVSCLH